MLGQNFRRGMHLKIDGREYTVESKLPSGDFQLRDVISNECRGVAVSILVEKLFSGHAELLGEQHEFTHLQLKQAKNLVNDFSALEENDPRKIKALRRLAYVKGLMNAGVTSSISAVVESTIRKVGQSIGETTPEEYSLLTPAQKAEKQKQPSCSSVRRWLKEYTAAGEDIRALAPSSKAQGNASRKICNQKTNCQIVLNIINDVINEEYLTPQRLSVPSIHETLKARIVQENRFRNIDEKLPIPHLSTLYRIVGKIDPYERDKARWGKRIADAKHKTVRQGPRPTRPLERVECDDTKLDLFAVDFKTMMPLGRPWLITVIDVYTKMILGFFLSFVHPSYLSVMQCLLHAIRPKTYLKDKYPEITHTWDTYGIMELLVVDNAKHWYSLSFEEACLQLGIAVQYAPPRIPWYKSSIERFFGTFNSRILHELPGTTFSNIIDKGDYDPKKNAIVSLELLEAVIHYWIVDIYQQSKHRGIQDVPARLWKIGIEKFPPALPPNSTELEVLLGHIEWRTISASGIELFCLYYNDPCLAAIRTGLKKGDKVKVKYDPTDLSLVYVYDKKNGHYLPIPAVDQDYTKGLTQWQHNVIRKYARQLTDGYVDIVALCLAKERIKEMIDAYMSSMRKSGTNVKVARWLSFEPQTRSGSIDPSSERQDELPATCDDVSPSDSITLLHPIAHPDAGISDLGSEFSLAAKSEDASFDKSIGLKINHNLLISPATAIETNPSPPSHHRSISKKKKSKSSSSRRSNLIHEENLTAPDKLADTSNSSPDQNKSSQIDNQELDMTGWSADYNLPT